MATPTALAMVADIGGTNARFALTDLCSPKPELLQQQSLRNAEFASLQHAAEQYLASVGVKPSHAAIVEAALDGHDLVARRTLARFCAVLGSVAGDAVLIHGARTVMIAGGIVPRFLPFLRSSAFRERFLAKGRFAAYLESVTIRIITHPNPGLLGVAMALRAAHQLESSA